MLDRGQSLSATTTGKKSNKIYLKMTNLIYKCNCICRYPGPVLIVRRSRDEMISSGYVYNCLVFSCFSCS